jgi:hypothetical protein
MSGAVALDTSPAGILRAMRGTIVAASIAYPGVLHVEVRDSTGAVWRLASQDADFSPEDPSSLVGCSIEEARIDEVTGGLRCTLSNGSLFEVLPVTSSQARDDPPSWELLTPSGMTLEFGPGLRWQIMSHDDPSLTS